MAETQQLVWNTVTNTWQQQTISTLYTARQIPGASVVYQVGAKVAGYVFDTFLGALNAIQASNTPTIMYVDGSAGQPVVPAGIYDLSLVTLMQMPGQTNVSLNFMDGASFSLAPSIIGGGLSLYSNSNSPVIDQPNLILSLKDGSSLQTAGTAPFIHVGVGATAQISLADKSHLLGMTAPVVSADGYSVNTNVDIGNWSQVSQGALDGYGAITANLISSSASILSQPDGYNLSIYNANASTGGGSDYSLFFALMPGDNAATVGVGTAVKFPQDGPTTGVITRASASTFNLPVAGDYEVNWQVSVAEPGQLQLAINGVGLPDTVVGRATGTSQLVGSTFITTAVANSILSLINPSGNSTALTITPVAGGASAVSATLTIKAL